MVLGNWGLGRVVTSWVVYWIALLGVGLAPVARQSWELQRRDGHGTVNFTSSGTSLEMILLVVGPPLLMTLLWLAARPRRP